MRKKYFICVLFTFTFEITKWITRYEHANNYTFIYTYKDRLTASYLKLNQSVGYRYFIRKIS